MPDADYDAWIAAANQPPPGEYVGGFFELIIKDLYTHLLRPGDAVIDGGANHGMHTFPMAACVGPTGRVFAVEAIPHLADALRLVATQRALAQITVVPKAISNREGTATFKVVAGDEAYSGLQQRDLPPGLETTVRTIDVGVTTIDRLAQDRAAKVGFIKLDLEGGELYALQGAEEVLRKDRPFVVFENGRFEGARWYGYSREEWFAFFERMNLVVFDILGRPFAPEDWNAPVLPWYYLAVERGSAHERFIREELRGRIARLHRQFLKLDPPEPVAPPAPPAPSAPLPPSVSQPVTRVAAGLALRIVRRLRRALGE